MRLLLIPLLITLNLLSQAEELHQCLISTSSSELTSLHPLLQDPYSRNIYLALFSDWIQQHKMNFETNEIFIKRLQIFVENDQFIRFHNHKNLPYQLGHNAFSHLTLEEWKQSKHFGFVSK